MKKLIVNHELVKVYQSPKETSIEIKLLKGGWVEHHPMPPTLMGLVSAMALATDIIAGKIFLKSVIDDKKSLELDYEQRVIDCNKNNKQ